MDKYDAAYTYEVHFPYTKELFYSNKGVDEFVELLREDGVENIHGEVVYLTVPVAVTYIKQIKNNKRF